MDLMQDSKVECVWDAGAELGEGPVWSVREQALYWVDILNHRLHRFAPSGGRQRATWQFKEEITSVAERANGKGLVVTLRHGFAFFDPTTEKLEPVLDVESDLPNNRFNDGKCDRAGRYWAGTMDFDGKAPTGSLYRLDENRQLKKFDSGYPVTNGPAWSLDGKTLYYNDSANGRTYAFDFDPESGEPSNKRLFLQLGEEEGSPDGMTTDAEGGLWIAQWGAGKVTRRNALGNVLQTLSFPCSQVAGCVFGGLELKTLFVTSAAVGLDGQQRAREPLAGGLFAVDLDIPGIPADSYRG